MMKRNALALVALAGLALLVVPGCAVFADLFGRPTVEGVRPTIKSIDLQGVTLAFEVDVKNPYVVPLASPRFRYGMDVEGAEFMAAQESEGADVPARGVGTLVLPVRLDYAALAQTYKTLSNANEFTYKLHGGLTFSAAGTSFDLPLSHEGKAPVVRPPTFSNISVRVAKASLTSLAVTVESDIKNPNVFQLGIDSLGYALKLGAASVADVKGATGGTIEPGKSGRVTLTGRLSGADALRSLAGGGKLGAPTLQPTGAIQTPYGAIKLQK